MRTDTGHRLLAVAALALVTACQPFDDGPRSRPARDRGQPLPPISDTGDYRIQAEPRSRYGNPESYEVFGKRYYVMDSAEGYRERGIASWYGPKFHGRLTSNREVYDMDKMTAAHKSLPLPTWVEVTNLENGRKVVVRVNDRGPFKDGRIIDLSREAARRLDMIGAGTALVEVRALDPRQAASAPPVAVPDSSRPALPPPDQGDGASAGSPPSGVPHIELSEDQYRAARAQREPVPPPVLETVREQAPAGEDGLPPVGTPQLYLQLGAFGDRANAERLMDRISGLADVGVRVTGEVRADGQQLWKVQVGPLPTVEAFDALTARLREAGFEEMHITIE